MLVSLQEHSSLRPTSSYPESSFVYQLKYQFLAKAYLDSSEYFITLNVCVLTSLFNFFLYTQL